MRTVDEIKESIKSELDIDDVAVMLEGMAALAEEEGPRMLGPMKRILKAVLYPTFAEGCVEGYKARARGILEALKVLKEAGISRFEAIRLLSK